MSALDIYYMQSYISNRNKYCFLDTLCGYAVFPGSYEHQYELNASRWCHVDALLRSQDNDLALVALRGYVGV